MKDLKFLISNDLMQGFSDINELFNIHKFFIENSISKQKDEAVEDFLEDQMTLLDSFCTARLAKIKENMIKSCRNKSKEDDE